uniref:Acetyl-coenzyme A transporter 1 n=1 Tax=Schistosoma haematobium TaxID=6185 RepID=A0A095B3K5_SCHHA
MVVVVVCLDSRACPQIFLPYFPLDFIYGISIGISAAIPFLLQSNYRTGGYNLQATFSISAWPHAMKLLWAPIVDSIYVNFIGRRKTWLIITQYAIGIELIVLASRIDDLFGRDPNKAYVNFHVGA